MHAAIYLTSLMSMTTMSVFLSVLVLRLHHQDTSTPTGPIFKLFYKFVAKIVAPLIFRSNDLKVLRGNIQSTSGSRTDNRNATIRSSSSMPGSGSLLSLTHI